KTGLDQPLVVLGALAVLGVVLVVVFATVPVVVLAAAGFAVADFLAGALAAGFAVGFFTAAFFAGAFFAGAFLSAAGFTSLPRVSVSLLIRAWSSSRSSSLSKVGTWMLPDIFSRSSESCSLNISLFFSA